MFGCVLGGSKLLDLGQDISLPEKQRDEMLRSLASIAAETNNIPINMLGKAIHIKCIGVKKISPSP